MKSLPPRLNSITRIIPTREGVRLDEAHAVQQLEQWYHTEASVRLNMITSLTGSAIGSDGTSGTLSDPIDRTILRIIRSQADVVLVGAATVRAEGYISPTSAQIAVLTRTGDIGESQFSGEKPPIFLCPEDSRERVIAQTQHMRAEVIALRSEDGDICPEEAVKKLTNLGLKNIVCEGGPSVATRFIASECIEELCLTVTPKITPALTPILPIDHTLETEVLMSAVSGTGLNFLRLSSSSN